MTIKVVINNKTDISGLVDSIAWGGDTKQVARKLSFSVLQNPRDSFVPKVTINEGDWVTLSVDGTLLFGGVIFTIEKSLSSYLMPYTAMDLLYYVNQSDINRVFNTTPENMVQQICAELNIPFGSAAKTGVKVYNPCLGKTAYEAIMAGYTAASKTTGKKYIPLIKNSNKICVIEKGMLCGAVLNDNNIIDANYKSSMESIVNKVLITDKNGKIIKTVQDKKSQESYGTVQRVYKQEDGKNATAEATALLHFLDMSGAVTALNDSRAVSGYAITVQEPITGLKGIFYIESDNHTFANGKAEMQLTLAFENLMDAKDIDKSPK